MAIPQGFDQIMLDACPTVYTTLLPLCPQVAAITAGGPTAFCEGGSVTLSASTDLDGAVIQWWANGQPLGIFADELITEVGGVYAVSVTYFDCPMLISNTIEVTVYPTPVATISGLNAQYCSNDAAVMVSAQPQGGVWTGPVMNGMFNPASAGPGTYEIGYSGFDANGCAYSTSVMVTVYQAPIAMISGLGGEYCSSNEAVPVMVSPAGGMLMGAGIQGMMFNPSAAGEGMFEIMYSGTDANGCAFATSVMVTVYEQPMPMITGAPGAICLANSNIQLGATYAGGMFSSEPQGAVSMDGMFMPSGPGMYAITYSGTYGPCTYSTSVMIEVTSDPVVTVFGLNEFYCSNGVRTTLSGQPAGGTFSGPGVDGDEFSPVLAGPGTHIVTYSGESNGCFYSAGFTVTVNTAISVAVVSANGPTGITQNNGSISVAASGGQGGYIYTLGSASNETGVFENLYAGLYVITVTAVSYTHLTLPTKA
jgi:hypothetical protein